MLGLHEIECETAWDCESAEQRIAGEFFPVILSDLRMRSDDDGFRILDAVQRLSPRSRVAAMTGFADDATVNRLRERGAMLVLRKPFLEEDLIAALQEMLQAVEEAAPSQSEDDDALYVATIDSLRRIARGRFRFAEEDIEELVQETWVLFLEKRHSVRTPKAWLTGTIANLCRREIERRIADRARAAEMPEPSIVPSDDAVLAVHQALARVDDRSRTLCTLIGLEQKSYEEVSASERLPIGSVGPLYLRAKEKLRRVLAA